MEEDESETNETGSAVATENIKWDEVLFTGSIIVGSMSKALISYPNTDTSNNQDPKKSRPRTKQADTEKNKHKSLTLGEIFNGYKVIEILPARIVFEKDGDLIAKFLYDQKNERIITQTITTSAVQTKPVPPKSDPFGGTETNTAVTTSEETSTPQTTTDDKNDKRPLSRSQRAMQRLMKETPLLEIPGQIPPRK
ncbi:MAG: hypothetical protein KKG70_13535 [Proteobacteria bacterium]|nr:hypothetical protein [Pseudomonadota bacterium]